MSKPENLPEEVRTAIDVIGNDARTEILRRLARQPMTTMELAEQLESHHASIHRHLVLLEEHGLVTADVPHGRRRGQTVTWQANRARIAEVGKTWVDYASGD